MFTYDLPADFDEEKDSKYQYRSDREDRAFLRRLDGGSGREIESRELTGLTPDFWEQWQGDWTVDGGGRLCLAHGGGVTVLDKAGAPAFDLETRVKEPDLLSGSRQVLALLADGSVGVMTGTEKETKVKVIDPAKKGWSETVYAAPAEAVRLYSGQGTFLFFCATKEALYGYTAGETDPYKLLEWSAAGVSGGAVQTFALWPGGPGGAADLFQRRDGPVPADALGHRRRRPRGDHPGHGHAQPFSGPRGTALQRRQ